MSTKNGRHVRGASCDTFRCKGWCPGDNGIERCDACATFPTDRAAERACVTHFYTAKGHLLLWQDRRYECARCGASGNAEMFDMFAKLPKCWTAKRPDSEDLSDDSPQHEGEV